MDGLLIRQARVEDLDTLLRHRIGMYEAMGVGNDTSRKEMAVATARVLPQAFAEGWFRGWLAEVAGKVVAGGGVVVTPWLSHPRDLICRKVTVLNVFTDPQYRRKGIARQLMQTILDWCRHEGFAEVFLHASHEGRPLYESLGFESGNEMKLKLK
jgi:GNAT superfamily N-acetyltransferase